MYHIYNLYASTSRTCIIITLHLLAVSVWFLSVKTLEVCSSWRCIFYMNAALLYNKAGPNTFLVIKISKV